MAMSADGSKVFLGSQLNDNAGQDAGHVRVFDLNNNGPAIRDATIAVIETINQNNEKLVLFDFNDQNLADPNNPDQDPDGDPITYSIVGGNKNELFA